MNMIVALPAISIGFLIGYALRKKPHYHFSPGISQSAIGNVIMLSPHVVYANSKAKFLLVDENGLHYVANLRRVPRFGPDVKGYSY